LEFYQVYPELVDNPFYITGESYAGHWIPALASRIIKNKRYKLISSHSLRIDGVSVGDGLTNPLK
jgi:carboxypeptidase C (cathepsin A)